MKIKEILVALLLIISNTVHAQSTNGKGSIFSQALYNANLNSYSSIDEAKSMIDNIIAVVGLKPKFTIKEANIPNAAAVIYGSKRYILYNPSFVTSLNKAAGNKWASVSILAHEIGHHLNGHTLESGGSKPEIELEADEFSGFVLRKMGATLQEAQVAMKIAAAQKASHTHPGQSDRLYSIAKGWNTANNQVTGKTNDVASIYKQPETSRPVIQQPQRTQQVVVVRPQQQTAINDKYILKDVYFNNDRNSNYYVTIRSHLVKVQGNNLSVLGKLVSNDHPQYPLLILHQNNDYWLINKYGRIITRDGREIGRLANHN